MWYTWIFRNTTKNTTANLTISTFAYVSKYISFIIHNLQNTRSPYNCQNYAFMWYMWIFRNTTKNTTSANLTINTFAYVSKYIYFIIHNLQKIRGHLTIANLYRLCKGKFPKIVMEIIPYLVTFIQVFSLYFLSQTTNESRNFYEAPFCYRHLNTDFLKIRKVAASKLDSYINVKNF